MDSVWIVVVQSQKGRLSKRGWPTPSEVNYEWNPRHSRTETSVADGGDVAVYAVKGSLSDASASGLNHQNPREDH